MALFKGDRKLTLFKGDRRPFAIYKGDKQITGAVKTHLEGTDIVKWESPYKAEIPNVETEGLGKQDKLSGKNLFDIKPYARYGVTLSKVKDYFELNGTATNSYNFSLTNNHIEKGKYFLSANNPQHSNISSAIVQVYSPSAGIITATDSTVNSEAVGSLETADDYHFRIRIENGVTYNHYIIKPQLEQGTQATEYEPYCGGIPAPNPLYPIEPRFNSGNRIKINTPPQEIDILILRAIPNTEFKDIYNLQRGIITRRVEELTLTGEENWRDDWKPNVLFSLQSNRWGIYRFTISNYNLRSAIMNDRGSTIGFKDMTEFGCNTTDEFKAFLKQKFTEGNPVKIWYALKTPYEEKISTIPLRQDWNGQIMQTGGDCGYAPMRADVFTEFRD